MILYLADIVLWMKLLHIDYRLCQKCPSHICQDDIFSSNLPPIAFLEYRRRWLSYFYGRGSHYAKPYRDIPYMALALRSYGWFIGYSYIPKTSQSFYNMWMFITKTIVFICKSDDIFIGYNNKAQQETKTEFCWYLRTHFQSSQKIPWAYFAPTMFGAQSYIY